MLNHINSLACLNELVANCNAQFSLTFYVEINSAEFEEEELVEVLNANNAYSEFSDYGVGKLTNGCWEIVFNGDYERLKVEGVKKDVAANIFCCVMAI